MALTMTPHEKVDSKIQHMLPRRKTNKNRPPSIKTVTTDEKVERWWFPTPLKQLTEHDKKTIVACIVQQLVKLVFDNHYYYWEGQIYRQAQGCPMGLEGSCPISRLVMDAWAEKLEERAEISQELHRINPVKYEPLTIYLLSKYVDDVLTGTETMKLGATYNKTDRVIEWSRDNESQQKETNPQENTMSILAEVASSDRRSNRPTENTTRMSHKNQLQSASE